MDLQIGGLDVRLEFHEVLPDQGKMIRERRASVVMSVPQFKALVGVLNSNMVKLDQATAAIEKALANKK
jgi:hypothetical protein